MNRHRKRAPDARKWWDQKKQLFRGQLLSRDRNFRTRQEKGSGIFIGTGIPGPGFIFSLIQNRSDLPQNNHRRTGPAHFFGFENQDRTSSEPVLSSRSGAQNLPGPARPWIFPGRPGSKSFGSEKLSGVKKAFSPHMAPPLEK